MNTKHYILIAVGVISMVGFNVFLAQRDSQLMKSYDSIQQQYNNKPYMPLPNTKEQYCMQLKVWHPDCNVE